MKLASIPARVPVPFADQGTKNAIPVNSQIGVKDGAASYTDGFPPLTMTPIAAGGIPPAGGDFNGILNAITQSVRWACAGGQYSYDDAFSTSIGGYPKGALIQNTAGDVFWLNTTDDNSTNPDTGAGWIPAIRYGLTSVALAGTNITLTPEQAAKETIVLTGTLTANVQVIMPAWVETWLVINNTTGAFTVSVKTSSGSGVNIGAGTTNQIYGDGNNIYYGALMVRNNLAEIKAAGTNSQAAARANLGLSDMSTANPNDFVPSTRKINNKQLNADITLNANDVSAVSSTGGSYSGTFKFGRIETLPTESNMSALYNVQAGVGGVVSGVEFNWYGQKFTVGITRDAGTGTNGLVFQHNGFTRLTIDKNGNLISVGEISSGGKIVSGAGVYDTPNVRVYSSNNPPPQQDLSSYAKRDAITYVGLESNNPIAPYLRQESTNAIIYLAPRDWVNGNFLTGVRLGAQAGANNNNSGWAMAPDGAVLTGSYQDTNYTAVYYRYPQYRVNGTWYNIGVA
ncbi:hypothetical protein DEO48_00920 [Enterobacter sp. CGMCC 5087]|uniref:hypothetical protein n=1 Tax=Enterobacter sp. CGMCC 5087 TaxID=2183878 RepID=UPI000D684DFF|nr:hypothetical protein [Enterobacter sp. CGMCC 5087]PWI81993.1 hypothetical protein DEO48_00920 [Enterobacter sp. CGMCC 5087]